VPPLFVVVLTLRFIRHEEKLMEATFGDAYRAYRARVRRFI
jgi:protein-S-isoprenylcysteine O-methyltransferase Ste14